MGHHDEIIFGDAHFPVKVVMTTSSEQTVFESTIFWMQFCLSLFWIMSLTSQL
jgi:L-fucose mutarotase/ribose pyranase (RbsD/FucU family)